jgi:SpoVK/Ycf46/Vps4 family AAA+-type ATPase
MWVWLLGSCLPISAAAAVTVEADFERNSQNRARGLAALLAYRVAFAIARTRRSWWWRDGWLVNSQENCPRSAGCVRCDQAKQDVMEFVDFLKDASRFTDLGTSTGAVVLAGTNRVDISDQALTRPCPGRFDRPTSVDWTSQT